MSNRTYAYDSNGNLAADGTPGAVGTTSYVYDVENRLVSASGFTNATLVYDPLGRLVQTSSPGGATAWFLYDGDRMIAEYDGAGTLTKRYVHGPGADEPVAVYEGPQLGLANRRYTLPDERGSIAALVNADGTPHHVNRYDSWGLPSTDAEGRSINQGRFQYTGQAWIGELGLYYYKARFYSPRLGRFMQTDPIGYRDELNLYVYARNDPINKADQTGLSCTYVEKTREYSCKMDRTGNWTPREIARANRNYTFAVNQLMRNSNKQVAITLNGRRMVANAGEVGRGLIRAQVGASSMTRSDTGASTLGGALTPEYAGPKGEALITINRNSVSDDTFSRRGTPERDLAVKFVHEGIHTIPQEAAFKSLYDHNRAWFNDLHQKYYKEAANYLFED